MKNKEYIKNLNSKDSKDLYKILKEEKENLKNQLLNKTTNKNKDLNIINKTKKNIAKIMTILNQKLSSK